MEPISAINQYRLAGLNPLPYVEKPLIVWDQISKVVSVATYPFSWLAQTYSWLAGRPERDVPCSAAGHGLIGSLPELAAHDYQLLSFINSYQAAYGQNGYCKLQLGTKTFYIITDPLVAKEIAAKSKAFIRGDTLRIWRKFSSDGLSEGEVSAKFRRQAFNAIGEQRYAHFYPSVYRIAEKWIERLLLLSQEGGSIDLMRECERATLAAFGQSLLKRNPQNPKEPNPFGLQFKNEALCTRFLDAYHTLFSLLSDVIPSALANIPKIGDTLYSIKHWDKVAAFESAKQTLQGILLPIYKDLLANPEQISQGSDFFKLLQNFEIDLADPDYDQILDHSLGFIQAAFETSSKALGWTLYALSLHPEVQNRLRSELLEAFEGKEPNSMSDLRKVPYLFQVLEECLRLYPPFPFLVRDIANPESFKAFEVKKNQTFVISPLLIHRRQDIWGEDSELFRPERFTSEMLTDAWQIDHPEYFTFYSGSHRCPGRFAAKQQLALLMYKLLRNFDVKWDLNQPEAELDFCITLQPKKPIYLRFEPINKV